MPKVPLSTPRLPKRLSLVVQTVESLREGIRQGHWQGHLPGERALAEHLQVSRRTLRAALDELQRQGWLEVTQRQRRSISPQHVQAPAAPSRKVVAVLMPGSFLSLPTRIAFVMDTLRRKLTAAGCEVQFHSQPAFYTGPAGRGLAAFVAQHPATVWLVLSAQAGLQQWFSQQAFSTLILGSCAPGVDLPSVDVDFHAACHHAGGVLWRRGHRHIALVLSKSLYGGDIASEEGLRESLVDHPEARLQVLRHDNQAASLCALLDETLRQPQPPTAYLVGGATHVLTVMMHLMRRGKRLPQDVTVISRDHDPILDATSPSVARYTIQPTQLATRIARAVRQLADRQPLPAHAIRLMPTFEEGESVGQANGKSNA